MPVQETPVATINNSVNDAHNAFLKYRKTSSQERAAFLHSIADLIHSNRSLLVDTAMQETFLPFARLDGEVTRTINQLRMFADFIAEGGWVKAIIDTAEPDRKPLPKPDLRQMQIAIGVVAVFGASNFPFAFSVAGGDTASALAAGCTVVYKAHPGHPKTSEIVATIIEQAITTSQMPEGCFRIIYGESNETGTALIMHPHVKAVGFTGSLNGGRALYNAAAQRKEPIAVYAEMGSINPVFIFPDILSKQGEELAEKLAASNLLSVGQFCTNPGFIVEMNADEVNAFNKKFSALIKNAEAGKMLTPAIQNGYNNGVDKLKALKEVEMLASGKSSDDDNASANMFQTTTNAFLNNKVVSQEVFGPTSVHVPVKSKDELMKIVNHLESQLTATIWATERDMEVYADVIDILEQKAGRIIYNGVPTGVEVAHAMMHGGPYPATTDSKTTSVGTQAIYRFTRPVCYQNLPQKFLPKELRNENDEHMWRFVNGKYSNTSI